MDELDKIPTTKRRYGRTKASDNTNFPDSINPINKACADKADDGAVDTAGAFNAGNAIDTDGSTVNDSEVTADGKVFGDNAVTGNTETQGTFTAHQTNGAENAATESGTENSVKAPQKPPQKTAKTRNRPAKMLLMHKAQTLADRMQIHSMQAQGASAQVMPAVGA